MINDLDMVGVYLTARPLPADTTLLKTTTPSECLEVGTGQSVFGDCKEQEEAV
jgi:hypothetical protein